MQLIKQWKKKHAHHTLKSFTFAQETIRFKDGEATDTSIWYEAIAFPDRFRIDIGEKAGNINLFRNDSIYVVRKDSLVFSGHRVPEALVMKGALYFQPVDSTLSNLKALDIDIDQFDTGTYEGRPAYIIGAKAGAEKYPQIWVDAERRNVLRRSSKLKNGKLLEVRYGDFVQVGGHWLESWVAFYIDGQLIQTERYQDIEVDVKLPETIFDPSLFSNSYWY